MITFHGDRLRLYRISDDQLLNRKSTLVGPAGRRSGIDEFGCFLRDLGVPGEMSH